MEGAFGAGAFLLGLELVLVFLRVLGKGTDNLDRTNDCEKGLAALLVRSLPMQTFLEVFPHHA